MIQEFLRFSLLPSLLVLLLASTSGCKPHDVRVAEIAREAVKVFPTNEQARIIGDYRDRIFVKNITNSAQRGVTVPYIPDGIRPLSGGLDVHAVAFVDEDGKFCYAAFTWRRGSFFEGVEIQLDPQCRMRVQMLYKTNIGPFWNVFVAQGP